MAKTEENLAEEREEEFYRAKRELEQFIHLALHDLRSPLNSSSVLARILQRRFGDELGDEGKWIAEQIVAQQKRMGDLITGISAFVDVTASTDARQVVALAKVIETALHNLDEVRREAGAQVEHPSLPTVWGHEHQFVEVFQHLIHNSIRYRSAEPPRITITAVPEGTSCTVCLRDNGVGFDPEFGQQIFEPFTRLHGDKLPGAGLGLSICKRIVRAHGGRIWAESQPSHGAVFFLTLPLAAV